MPKASKFQHFISGLACLWFGLDWIGLVEIELNWIKVDGNGNGSGLLLVADLWWNSSGRSVAEEAWNESHVMNNLTVSDGDENKIRLSEWENV